MATPGAQLYLVGLGVFGGEQQGRLHAAGGFWPYSARANGAELHPSARSEVIDLCRLTEGQAKELLRRLAVSQKIVLRGAGRGGSVR
jgi:hypothetical protein